MLLSFAGSSLWGVTKYYTPQMRKCQERLNKVSHDGELSPELEQILRETAEELKQHARKPLSPKHLLNVVRARYGPPRRPGKTLRRRGQRRAHGRR